MIQPTSPALLARHATRVKRVKCTKGTADTDLVTGSHNLWLDAIVSGEAIRAEVRNSVGFGDLAAGARKYTLPVYVGHGEPRDARR